MAKLLPKYVNAVRSAWKLRHEIAGPIRLADENAFLPASLSLQETPVHPAPRRTALLFGMIFVSVIVWALMGTVDIVAVAPGRLVVRERNKHIQPLAISSVKRVLVRDGDHVERDQPLVELDPTNVNADKQNTDYQFKSIQSELLRAKALKKAISATSPSKRDLTIVAPSNWNLDDLAVANAYVAAEWNDINAKSAKLGTEIARRQAEVLTVMSGIQKLQTTLPLVIKRESDFLTLANQGFVSHHAGQDRTKEKIEIEQDLATQNARLAESRAALVESQNNRSSYLAEVVRTLHEREMSADLKRLQMVQEQIKVEQRAMLTVLKSPVKGTVQQLAVNTDGGVVTEAQILMVVVPDDAQIRAEIMIDNKDIGYVFSGQDAELKLETFNFTRYGTVSSEVETVSADAIIDEKRGAVFSTVLKLKQNSITIEDKVIRLSPGMNLTAEIKTGERKIIDFILSPLKKTGSESFRER